MRFIVDVTHLTQRFNELATNAHKSIKEESIHTLQTTLALSKPLTPVDTGALVNSPQFEFEGESTVGVTWGVPYAIIVHEDLLMNHPRGGQAKFASRAFEQAIEGYGQRVMARLRT